MGTLFRLEAFDTVPQHEPELDPTAGLVPEAEIEVARLEGYERGYQSGWDDAMASATEERSRLGTEFSRNLQDLSFTYHEARAHVMRGVEQLLEEMVATFLPRTMREALGRTILDEVENIASEAADAPLEILASAADAPALREMMETNLTMPVRLVEEATLAEGQVYFRLGHVERSIDLAHTLTRMAEALGAARDLNGRTLKHG